MSRLSIDVPDHQHKRIKALAALHGQSLKDYIIGKTIPTIADADDEEQAFKEFMEILTPRIEEFERGEYSPVSIESIIKEAKAQSRS